MTGVSYSLNILDLMGRLAARNGHAKDPNELERNVQSILRRFEGQVLTEEVVMQIEEAVANELARYMGYRVNSLSAGYAALEGDDS